MTTTANVDSTAQPPPWIPADDTFGARLALVRQRMGWGNVAEAAQACGIPVPSWRNWERDGRLPRNIVEVASIISGRTGCDYLWLLSGRGGRVLTTVGEPRTGFNHRSGRRHRRLAPTAGKTRRTRGTRIPCPKEGPRPSPVRPASPIPPTQRRPMPISGPGQRIST